MTRDSVTTPLFWVLEDSMSAPVVKGFSYVGRVWWGKTQQAGQEIYPKPESSYHSESISYDFHMILTHYDMNFGRVLTAVDRSLSRTPM